MQAVCVYCGSSPGTSAAFRDAAVALAAELCRRNVSLVYGGASKGMMGLLADAMLEGGGRVVGVIPRTLQQKEIAHPGLDELHVVESMHERKAMMSSISDGFVAMPGGFGTLEEIIESLTWAQLGFHDHPCGLLNVRGYFDRLIGFLEHAVAEEFVRPEHREMLLVESDPAELLARFDAYRPPGVSKWRE